MVALVCLLSLGLAGPAASQSPDDMKKAATMTTTDSPTQDSGQQKNNGWSPLLKGLIIALIVIIAAAVFWLFAPFFPIFQSKGSPDEIIEKMGCEEGDKEGKKVLVGYCSRHGATVGVALKIGEVLCDKGFQVDVRSVLHLGDDDLSKYDAFVVGSGVLWSKLVPAFQDFIAKYRHIWPQKPHALFLTCMTIQTDNEKNRNFVRDYFNNSIKHVPEFEPFDRCGFAGRVDYEKLTFWESSVFRLILWYASKKSGDLRDMNKVAVWAEKISTSL